MMILKFIFIILVFIGINFLTNKFFLLKEKNKIMAYGKKIEIKGKKINILEKGLENKKESKNRRYFKI